MYGQRYQGEPCRRGHSGERYVSNDGCVDCVLQWASARRRTRGEKVRPTGSVNELHREAKARRKGYAPPPREVDCPPRPADGKCQSCKRVRPLVLDHDHFTGAFRGWTCRHCNVGIGVLGDTVADLQRALAYLLRHYAPEYEIRTDTR